MAYLQSKKPNSKEYTLMEHKVTEKIKRKIKDAINKASRQIINYAIKNEISEIIIGYNTDFKNKGIKQEISKKLKSE